MSFKEKLKWQFEQLTPKQRLKLKGKVNELILNQSKHSSIDKEHHQDKIAIIGMAFRFPKGINDVESLWELLSKKHNVVGAMPVERFKDSPLPWQAGYLNNVDGFDASFFNISPREAQLMDPQQRLLLQVIWQAIENAGYNPLVYSKLVTGLFVGLSTYDYQELLRKENINSAYSVTGTSPAMMSNRISYWFDFTGPSETIDTACSSSLVALHHAITALQTKQCEQAVVGAANLLLAPSFFKAFEDAGMLSPSGSCKTFDREADGYVRGEGIIALCLKPLARAKEDGDSIYATIIASAVNHGGKANSLTAPNPQAQKRLIQAVYNQAKIPLHTVSYIETHGTGTVLGDPIELEALTLAFKEMSQEKPQYSYCGLGTIKTNIGHLEAAAGLAGLVKVIVSMHYKQLPGIANFSELNPHINLQESSLYIVENTSTWPTVESEQGSAHLRRAGISSFGFGGTNAHIVVEEFPQSILSQPRNPYYLLVFSAKNKENLLVQINCFYKWLLQSDFNSSIEEIAFTLGVGRHHFSHRCAFVINNIQALKHKIAYCLSNSQDYPQPFPGFFYEEAGADNLAAMTEYNKLQEIILNDLESVKNNEEKYLEYINIIAQIYIQGATIDWEKFFSGRKLNRVHLPSYTFAEKRYWYSDEHNLKNQFDLKDLEHMDDNSLIDFLTHLEKLNTI
ncbi:type I polyketide synthase [Legionella septentrionalis]|uniref:type I polyketide synthase n=1 Tax=Legionella septentrionalis TaxID=2498109 RepID=UPI001315293A|nr:polyketide synthase [Legionella septentrionalis]